MNYALRGKKTVTLSTLLTQKPAKNPMSQVSLPLKWHSYVEINFWLPLRTTPGKKFQNGAVQLYVLMDDLRFWMRIDAAANFALELCFDTELLWQVIAKNSRSTREIHRMKITPCSHCVLNGKTYFLKCR